MTQYSKPPTFADLGIFTIDPLDSASVDHLRPATPETRAEVKAARRAEQRKSMKEMAIAYGVFFLLAAFFALGTIVGNVNDADVRDIHIPVPSPSGERAEPEGGQ